MCSKTNVHLYKIDNFPGTKGPTESNLSMIFSSFLAKHQTAKENIVFHDFSETRGKIQAKVN